jgi:DNA-binding transcriptional LysR family regulator
MELRDIEYFAVVAEHKSIARAAETLGLSQPALSKSLRRLEQSVHAKVVKRTTTGIELTAVGSALLAQVGRLRLTLDDISREAADLGGGRAGHLRIATGPGLALRLIPEACNTLRNEAPKATLMITVDTRNAMVNRVRNGELDLAITSIEAPRHEDLVDERLYDETYEVYAAANHRLAKRKQLTLADLVDEQWVMATTNNPAWQRLNQAFVDCDLPSPKIGVATTYLPLRQQLVATSDLLAFGSNEVTRYAVERLGVVQLRVKELTVSRRVGVIYRKDAYLPPVGQRFIEILKSTAKTLMSTKS